MKPPVHCLLFMLGSFLLLCTQITLLKYEPNLPVNFIVLAYIYTLTRNFSAYTYTLLLCMLELYLFLQTGVFYAVLPMMAILSWVFIRVQNDFYNKLVPPSILIVCYTLIESLYFFATLHYRVTAGQLIESIVIHIVLFVLLWKVTKQPLHH